MEETIENRARLVKLKIRKWTARKYDANVGISVAQKVNSNARSDTLGRFNKVLIPEVDPKYPYGWTSYGKLESAIRSLRNAHKEHTLPWENGEAGYRLLPGEKFMEHAEAMREKIAAYESARDEFFKDYPRLVQENKTRLGPMASYNDFPAMYDYDTDHKWGIYAYYDVSLTSKSVPQTDFRTKLTQVELDDLERTTQARIDAAVKEALANVHPVVKDSQQDSLLDSMKGLYGTPNTSNI